MSLSSGTGIRNPKVSSSWWFSFIDALQQVYLTVDENGYFALLEIYKRLYSGMVFNEFLSLELMANAYLTNPEFQHEVLERVKMLDRVKMKQKIAQFKKSTLFSPHYATILLQIKLINKASESEYANLVKDAGLPSILDKNYVRFILAKLALIEKSIGKRVIETFNNLGLKLPVTNSIDETSVLGKFSTMLAKQLIGLEQLQRDAEILHRFLTPAIAINRNPAGITEQEIDDVNYFEAEPPHAIMIFGNNDLKSIEHVALLLKRLRIKDIHIDDIPIFISGKGGHGVTSGPIFSLSEAETMARRLKELGVKNKMILETQATNSGENIILTAPLIVTEASHLDKSFLHFLIVGSPVGILRQLRTLEKQLTYKDWVTLSTFPQNWHQIKENYYALSKESLINFYSALREMGTLISYTLLNHFMTSRPFDIETLVPAIKTFVIYYHLLTGREIQESDLTAIISKFIQFTAQKSVDNIMTPENQLRNELIHFFQPMTTYFRIGFNQLEKEWMKILPNQIADLWQQSALVAPRTYGIFNLEPALKHEADNRVNLARCNDPTRICDDSFKNRSFGSHQS